MMLSDSQCSPNPCGALLAFDPGASPIPYPNVLVTLDIALILLGAFVFAWMVGRRFLRRPKGPLLDAPRRAPELPPEVIFIPVVAYWSAYALMAAVLGVDFADPHPMDEALGAIMAAQLVGSAACVALADRFFLDGMAGFLLGPRPSPTPCPPNDQAAGQTGSERLIPTGQSSYGNDREVQGAHVSALQPAGTEHPDVSRIGNKSASPNPSEPRAFARADTQNPSFGTHSKTSGGSVRIPAFPGFQTPAARLTGVILLLSLSLPVLALEVTLRLLLLLDPTLTIPPHSTIDALRNPDLSPVLVAGLWITAGILAPLAEELFFRGIVQTAMGCLFANRWSAVLVASAAFAAVHWDQKHTWPALFVFGMLLGFLYERTGALAGPILVHAAFNLKTLLWEALASRTL